MNLLQVKDKLNIPDSMKNKLQGKSIDEQLIFFRLEHCYRMTTWLDEKIQNPENMHGQKAAISEDMKVLIQDNIVVGIKIADEELISFINPCSKIHSFNGHRTSNDGWGYEEEHEWYIFRYME